MDLVEKARKQKLKEVATCEKELKRLYEEAFLDMHKKIATTNSNLWAMAYQKELADRISALTPKVQQKIQSHVLNSAKIGASPDITLFKLLGEREILQGLAKIPEEVTRELLSGKFYKDNLGLSQRVWAYAKQDKRGVDYIIQRGLIEKKSTLELAKDLEKYLDPNAKKDFEWRKVYPNAGYKSIDFNAYRLASTSITHAYQLSTIRCAEQNPFAEGVKWHSALSHRSCEICRDRHGKVYQPNEVPLDHPLGLCTTYCVITKSMEEIGKELREGIEKSEKSVAKTEKTVTPKKKEGKKKTKKESEIKKTLQEKNMDLATQKVLEYGKKTGNEGLIWLNDEGVEIIPFTTGTSNKVAVSRENMNYLKSLKKDSVISLHNHPSSSSFSPQDMDIACKLSSVKELRVIGHDGTKYFLRIGEGKRPDFYVIDDAYWNAKIKLDSKYYKMLKENNDQKLTWKEHSNEVVEMVAKQFGWEYRRE